MIVAASGTPSSDGSNGEHSSFSYYSWMIPIASFGLGYPQGLAASLGLLFPVTEITSKYMQGHPTISPIYYPALRIEAEVGGFGEGVAVGITQPLDKWGMVTLKRERIFENWQGPRDESCSFFDGYVVEYGSPGGKIGLGSFTETKSFHNTQRSFIYVSIGLGM